MNAAFPLLTAAEAASFIEHGQNVAFSGFTPAGAPKAVPLAIAERAEAAHHAGEPFETSDFELRLSMMPQVTRYGYLGPVDVAVIVAGGHTPHTLSAAFRMHEQFQKTGDMRGCRWETPVAV